MEFKETTIKELKEKYHPFLSDNIKGQYVTEIASKTQKSPRTVYTYIQGNGTDFITYKAIISECISLLETAGIKI